MRISINVGDIYINYLGDDCCELKIFHDTSERLPHWTETLKYGEARPYIAQEIEEKRKTLTSLNALSLRDATYLDNLVLAYWRTS